MIYVERWRIQPNKYVLLTMYSVLRANTAEAVKTPASEALTNWGRMKILMRQELTGEGEVENTREMRQSLWGEGELESKIWEEGMNDFYLKMTEGWSVGFNRNRKCLRPVVFIHLESRRLTVCWGPKSWKGEWWVESLRKVEEDEHGSWQTKK